MSSADWLFDPSRHPGRFVPENRRTISMGMPPEAPVVYRKPPPSWFKGGWNIRELIIGVLANGPLIYEDLRERLKHKRMVGEGHIRKTVASMLEAEELGFNDNQELRLK